MKTAIIRSSWMPGYGYRLDTKPYVGGALQAKLLLEELPLRKDSLTSLTKGHDGGIFNGPQFRRNYVEDPNFGVPFMTGSTMQLADLSGLNLLSKKDAKSSKLSHLKLEKGMTLISCSGTIGKMAYVRPEMEGIWSSQDILKVVPDPGKIPPGYLYAFLSSKFGVPLVTSGTYGAIIQHLEPEHIAEIDVPRLDPAKEQAIHELVEEAGRLLTEHNKELRSATIDFFACVEVENITSLNWRQQSALDQGFAVNSLEPVSFRPVNYSKRLNLLIDGIKSGNWLSLGELCHPGFLGRGSRFKRIDAESTHARLLIGQRDLFSLKPDGRSIAEKSIPRDALMRKGGIAVAARGTLGENELYCRAQLISGPWANYAYSEDILRIIPDESKMPLGCLFAFLRSETAFRLLRGVTCGLNMQEPHYWLLPRLPIPLPQKADIHRINNIVVNAVEKRHLAVAKEKNAISTIEHELTAR